MKFGLRYCNTGRYTDPVRAVELIEAAEAAGFESAWTIEHTIIPANYESPYPYSADGKLAGGRDDIPLPDPLIWMAYVGARCSTIKLATGILILPQHPVVHVAKQVATLDHMIGGRTLLGIGTGWLREEFEALGADFATRGPRTDEYIEALRRLWRERPASMDGDYVSFRSAYCEPQPPAQTVPIIVGGHSRAAARRAGRLGDGFFPARGADPDLLEIARQAARDAGRDPNALEITASMPASLDDIEALAQRGVGRILVPVNPMPGMNDAAPTPERVLAWREHIERFESL